MRTQWALGAACGLTWGTLAAGYWAAMSAALLPPPNEIGMPFVIVLALALVPLIVATQLETIVGLGSPSLEEHLAATVVCGLAFGVAGIWLIMLVRRGAVRAS